MEAHERGMEAAMDTYDDCLGNLHPPRSSVDMILRNYLEASGQVLVPREMTPKMMRNAQMYSEIGSYVTANWAGAYDTMDEYWTKLLEAAPNPFHTPNTVKQEEE